MIQKLLKSRTTWVVVVAFLVGGIEAISGFIPTAFLPYVTGFLGLLTLYFKQNPSQNYGKEE